MSPSTPLPVKRGYYTSFIQTTATLGLFLALLLILGIRNAMGEDPLRRWGWRIPFLLSGILLARFGLDPLRLNELPDLPEDEGRGHNLEARR